MSKYRLSESECRMIDHHFSSCPFDSPVQFRVHQPDYPSIAGSRKDKYGVYSFLKKDGTLRFHLGDQRKSGLSEASYYSVNNISPTITCSWAPKLWDLKRILTPRECLRLMGFDNKFNIVVSDEQMYRQAGNSIVVDVLIVLLSQINFDQFLTDDERRKHEEIKGNTGKVL